MKKLIWILFIFFACAQKEKSNCNFPELKEFSIYRDIASIKLPVNFFESSDSSNRYFEYDSSLIYIRNFYSLDTLSSAYITGRLNPLPNENFVNYAKEVENYYKSLFDYKKWNSQVDTLKDNKLYKFSLLSKRDAKEVAIGGVLFYVQKVRFEIFITLNQSNIDSIENKIECIINSLIIKEQY